MYKMFFETCTYLTTIIHSQLSNVICTYASMPNIDDLDIITGFSNEYRTEAFGS